MDWENIVKRRKGTYGKWAQQWRKKVESPKTSKPFDWMDAKDEYTREVATRTQEPISLDPNKLKKLHVKFKRDLVKIAKTVNLKDAQVSKLKTDTVKFSDEFAETKLLSWYIVEEERPDSKEELLEYEDKRKNDPIYQLENNFKNSIFYGGFFKK